MNILVGFTKKFPLCSLKLVLHTGYSREEYTFLLLRYLREHPVTWVKIADGSHKPLRLLLNGGTQQDSRWRHKVSKVPQTSTWGGGRGGIYFVNPTADFMPVLVYIRKFPCATFPCLKKQLTWKLILELILDRSSKGQICKWWHKLHVLKSEQGLRKKYISLNLRR